MRALVALLALLALGGCTPTDPNLAKPCGKRGPPSVVIGTGQYAFEIIGTGGLPIETDPTLDTSLLWLSVGCRGLGPNVRVNYGITDNATDAGVTAPVPPLEQGQLLTYDPDLYQDEASQLWPYFQFGPGNPFTNEAQLINRPLTFWAEVSDNTCPEDEPDGGPVQWRGEKASFLNGYDPTSCTGCLHSSCEGQLAACGPECLALQVCLDTHCWSLSATGSPADEMTCQMSCEALHPTGVTALVDLANCVQASPCQPPCQSYSIDYQHCYHGQDNTSAGGACGALYDACLASEACQAFEACETNIQLPECQATYTCYDDPRRCTTIPECEACSAVPGGAEGEATFEAWINCIETTCIAQAWIAHINPPND